MNERIEDLMYHAGLTAQGCWDQMDEYDQKAIEKFAELIVRECVEIVERYGTPDGYYIADEINRIMLNIRTDKHFGVEE